MVRMGFRQMDFPRFPWNLGEIMGNLQAALFWTLIAAKDPANLR